MRRLYYETQSCRMKSGAPSVAICVSAVVWGRYQQNWIECKTHERLSVLFSTNGAFESQACCNCWPTNQILNMFDILTNLLLPTPIVRDSTRLKRILIGIPTNAYLGCLFWLSLRQSLRNRTNLKTWFCSHSTGRATRGQTLGINISGIPICWQVGHWDLI